MSTPGRQHQTHGLLSCEFLTCSASHRSWNQRQRGHDSHQNTERAWIIQKHREGMNHTKTQRGHESYQKTQRGHESYQKTQRAWIIQKHREGMNHTKKHRGHDSHQNYCNFSFHLMFLWFNQSNYCGENCTCTGQSNKNVGHFVVLRSNLIVARACFPCSPHHTVIFAYRWPFCGCRKNFYCEIKPDCWTPEICCGLLFAWLRCLSHSSYHSAPSHTRKGNLSIKSGSYSFQVSK